MEFKDQVLSIHGLSKEQTLGRFGDLEAKKIMKGTQIFKLKSLTKLSYQSVQELGIVASDDNVIYID